MCIGTGSPKVQTPPTTDTVANEQNRQISAANQQAKKRQGFGSTMLTQNAAAAPTRKTSMLGGSPM